MGTLLFYGGVASVAASIAIAELAPAAPSGYHVRWAQYSMAASLLLGFGLIIASLFFPALLGV
jgi:hypothetical protein